MKELKKLLRYSAFGLLALATQVQAAGYKMEFQSPSVLADGGQAAVVEDAGTNWYNAAGLTRLPQQLNLSIIDVYAPTTFYGSTAAPSTIPPIAGGTNFTGSGSTSSHVNVVLPAVHYSLPIKDRYAFGISMVPYFGFIEDFGLGNSMVRYTLTRVYTKNIDISPSFAVKVNDHWSLAAGPDFNYFAVSERFNVRTEGPPFGTVGDSMARFSSDTWGYGWHAGILFTPTESTRFGLAYRSKIVMDMDGFSSFNIGATGPQLSTNQFKLNLPLPPVTTFSAYHDINERWAVMGSIEYDQWSVIRSYNAFNIIQPNPAPPPTSTLTNLSILQSFNNTFDYSLGAHYKYSDRVLFRGSLKYIPTPTNNRDRDISFPDSNKVGLNLGARYQMTKKLAVDLIYGHAWTQNAKIRSTNPLTGATASGHASTTIDFAGGQLVWDI